jgi:hypothetical protein
VLVMNWPVPPGGSRRAGGWRRLAYKARRLSTTPLRVEYGYDWLDRSPERTYALMYEPPPLVTDWLYAYTRERCERVYGPDPRATHPIVLPSMWTFEDDLHALRAMGPPEKTVAMVAANAGRPHGKRLITGHLERLAFFQAVKAEGMPLEIYGRGMPPEVGGGGPVASKANIMRPARLALVIENYAEGEQYITEKLWDALLCWCLPVYHGSRAAERLLPEGSFVRLPDFGRRGLALVRKLVEDPGEWERRLPQIAEARRRAMGELRLVEWAARELVGAAAVGAGTARV